VSETKQMNVAAVMQADFLIMDGVATVAEALAEMKQRNAHSLLVDKRDEQDEYGIVLVSDIAKQVLAQHRSPQRVNVYEIMSKPVLAVQPDMHIRFCARLFERFGISTAPVIEDGKIVGVVTYDALVLKGLAASI
jgi:predicted transcriptional regulator